MNITIKKLVCSLAVVVLIAAAAFLVYFNQPQTVTTMTQQEAESVQGVEKAATNASVPLSVGQAKEVVTQIKEIRTTEQVPVYITQTTAAEAPAKIEEAREQAKADFAIVTSKADVDLNKLDRDTPVELNQYNIKAYPKALRQVEVGRGMDGGMVVGASVSKKITDNGQYLGVGMDYDIDRGRVMAKVIYTW